MNTRLRWMFAGLFLYCLSAVASDAYIGEPVQIWTRQVIDTDDPGGVPTLDSSGWLRGSVMPRRTGHMQFTLSNFRKGSTAPANATMGDTPAIPYMDFAATNERLGWFITLPDDWSGTGDVELHLTVILTGAETVGDAIEFASDYVVVRSNNASIANGAGGTVTQANTTVTATASVVTGATGAGAEYHVILTFARTDATNPITAYPSSLLGEIYRTSVGGAGKAGAVGLTGGHFHYTRQ